MSSKLPEESRSTEESLSTEEQREVAALHLKRWFDPVVVVVAFIALASGFGQFGAVAALGDVSKQLGHMAAGASIADKVGLSGTSLGIGLAIIRLASLGSLPLVGIADRFGRRPVILTVTFIGLALTVAAAASPGYWWFVVIFAFGRPLLSATNALAELMATEETSTRDRTAAVSLVAAGYGVGAGISAIVHSLASGVLGFRGMFALTVAPLVAVYAVRGRVEEPSRFIAAEAQADHPTPVLGAIEPPFRNRVIVLALIAVAISVVTGPANSFAFLYAEDVLHQAGWVTAAMVAGAGAAGLFGLLTGRWLSDHVGRRPTGSVATIAIALTGTFAYTGSKPAFVLGYILGVISGSLLAPAIGAMLTELFPTEVRASVAGWWVIAGVLGAVGGLVVFGAVADVGNRFAEAAQLTFLPTAVAAVLFWFVPETKGREPEELWPEYD
jgi:MFS family permease